MILEILCILLVNVFIALVIIFFEVRLKVCPDIYKCDSGRYSKDVQWYKGGKHRVYESYKFWELKHVWGPIYKLKGDYLWFLEEEFISN